MATVLVSILVVLVIAGGAWVYFLHAPATRPPALTGTATAKTVVVAREQRTYIAYTPAHLKPERPLLIVLHGTQQQGKTARYTTGYRFDQLADQHGFAVLYPNSMGIGWNDCRPKTGPAAVVDDVGFIDALIAQVVQDHAISPEQVYLFGYSNGGQMVFRLLSEEPTAFAGAAVVAANLPTPEYNQCGSDRPTPPILLANGTADPITPFAGGKVSIFGVIDRGSAISAAATAQHFAALNGAAGPTQSTVSAGVERWAWTKEGKSYVERYAFAGAGHVIPQPVYRFPRLMGATPAFDLPKRVVDFLGLAA